MTTEEAGVAPLERPVRPVSEARSTGHYFEFKRGQWVKDGDKPTTFYQASGSTYLGCLTLEQRQELDALIDKYLKSIDA